MQAHKTLIRIQYSLWDIQQATSVLTFLLEDFDFEKKHPLDDLRRFKCYETSMIISFARPFITSRSASTLGLKKLGIKLNQNEETLKEKLLNLRIKIFAHSDEDFMHFKSSSFLPFDDKNIHMPQITYDETLHFSHAELLECKIFFYGLIRHIAEFLFAVTQTRPEAVNFYQQPLHNKT